LRTIESEIPVDVLVIAADNDRSWMTFQMAGIATILALDVPLPLLQFLRIDKISI
jgi:hypothetical protein